MRRSGPRWADRSHWPFPCRATWSARIAPYGWSSSKPLVSSRTGTPHARGVGRSVGRGCRRAQALPRTRSTRQLPALRNMSIMPDRLRTLFRGAGRAWRQQLEGYETNGFGAERPFFEHLRWHQVLLSGSEASACPATKCRR